MAQPQEQGTGDQPDSKRFQNMGIGEQKSQATVHASSGTSYNMKHKKRGKFIIINNRTFQPETGMNERTGTDVDASNLYSTSKRLGFTPKTYHNLTTYQMLKIMQEAGEEDHSDCDSIAVAILSHGEQGIVYGVDGVIEIEKLVEPLKRCTSLFGKPKLFFIQACRGTQLDDGIEVESDADAEQPRQLARIPMEADFLYAYSTTPGYFSWRNSSKGSWFVQALCHVLNRDAFSNLDLSRMLTRVNHMVAYEFESNAAQQYMTRKKQIPSIVSMLTKDLYFNGQ